MAGHRRPPISEGPGSYLTWKAVALLLGLVVLCEKGWYTYSSMKIRSDSLPVPEEKFLEFEKHEVPKEDPEDVAKEKDCTVAMTYIPAAWEDDFVTNMTKYQEGSVENLCRPLRKYKPLVDDWLKLVDHISKHGWDDLPSWSKSAFSYFRRTRTCKGGVKEVLDVPIEPLVSFLRHPMYLCFDRSNRYRVAKEYMILSHPGLTNTKEHGIKKYMFDAGASSYRQGAGGASSYWFIESYRKNGVEFDDMYCWEASGNQKQLLAEYPFDILVKTHYFVIPVSPDKNSFHNVLKWIKYKAREEDYVVFKLDIDTPIVETALAKQMLEPEIASLVDEFFFEDHVSKSPMEDHGWTHVRKDHDLAHSIVYFQKLRKLGVRAHSWV